MRLVSEKLAIARCRFRHETSTVLNTLPASAQLQEVVARIDVIEVLRPPWVKNDDWRYTHLIRVRVVEAIKEVQQNQTFLVETRGTSCDQAFPKNDPRFAAHMIVWRPYIAGQFEHSHSRLAVFRGAWKIDGKTGERLPAQ